MDSEMVATVMDALRESEIDLVVTLPEEPTHGIPEATQKDPFFTTVIAAGEGNGLAVCAGASLSGRDCVFITGVAGLLVGTWALSQCGTNYGAPFVILACYRGDWGDPTAIGGGQQAIHLLDAEELGQLAAEARQIDVLGRVGRADPLGLAELEQLSQRDQLRTPAAVDSEQHAAP